MANPLRTSSRSIINVPVFLAPAFAETRLLTANTSTSRLFSSSTRYNQQKRKVDANKQRGVSALRSTGPRTQMTLPKHLVLPQPAKDAVARRAEFDQDQQDHGLWAFFDANKSTVTPPMEEGSHGRPWAIKELRRKDYTDLLKLYWVCIKEANQIATRQNERSRVYAGYGASESDERMLTVKTTQRRIRRVLLERHDEYNNARNFVEIKQMSELFPDAEQELGLVAGETAIEPEIHVAEVGDTTEVRISEAEQDPAKLDQQSPEKVIKGQDDALRKQKLAE